MSTEVCPRVVNPTCAARCTMSESCRNRPHAQRQGDRQKLRTSHLRYTPAHPLSRPLILPRVRHYHASISVTEWGFTSGTSRPHPPSNPCGCDRPCPPLPSTTKHTYYAKQAQTCTRTTWRRVGRKQASPLERPLGRKCVKSDWHSKSSDNLSLAAYRVEEGGVQ